MVFNTWAVLHKIYRELRKLADFLCMFFNVFYIIPPLYAILTDTGYQPVNIVLCTCAVAYFIYYAVTYGVKSKKYEVRTVTRAFRIIRLAGQTLMLFIALYPFIVSDKSSSSWGLLFVVLSVIGWLFNFLTYLLVTYIDDRWELIESAFEMDKNVGGKIKSMFDTRMMTEFLRISKRESSI